MAKRGLQSTTQILTRSFTKGLNKDADPTFVQEGMWTHTRNAVNNTEDGNLGTISNEISNFLCATSAATMPANVTHKYIIGAVLLFSDKWIIFTAGHDITGRPISSEIGLLETDDCIYRPIVQDACLNFDKRYLITGASREKEDCTWQVYWADGLNPDRYLNVGDPNTWPTNDYTWVGQTNINYYSNGSSQILWPGVTWTEITKPGTCEFIQFNNTLDCDKIRLARLMSTPCLKLSLGNQGGTLRNGTYFATLAYSIKGQKVSDYFSQSNNQPIWFPADLQGSLTLEIEADTENFDEFILVIVQNINQGTVAKQYGIYSTKTTKLSIDQIKEDSITVPLEQLPLQTPIFEKSDQIAEVNNYLLRVGPTSRFDFNYQPLANLIKAKWASVEYPADYYVKGGNKGSYLRDEVYSFFIRWVYNTGDKSASYHIPGRPPRRYPTITSPTWEYSDDTSVNALNAGADPDRIFEVTNTAILDPLSGGIINTTTADGGKIIATGQMGYWESEEVYPDNRPDIWNSSYYCWTAVKPSADHDLCGLPIRHHKFPDNYIQGSTANAETNHYKPNLPNQPNPLKIRLMGVYFENISYPKDNDGNDIQGIVGYEILRGSREGNKTIIAKGMLNNFRTYQVQGQVASSVNPVTGLYANHPFNTIKPFYNIAPNTDYNDPYIRAVSAVNPNTRINQSVPTDIVSFHSPDTMFRTPFLSTTELKLYGYMRGVARQTFVEPNKHPEHKLLSDFALIPVFIAGILEAILSMSGKLTLTQPEVTGPGYVVGNFAAISPQALAGVAAAQVGINIYNPLISNYLSSGSSLADSFSQSVGAGAPILQGYTTTIQTALNTAAGLSGTAPSAYSYSYAAPDWAYLGPVGAFLGATNQLLFYFSEGARVALDLIRAVIPYEQYALQMIAHGFYDDFRRNNSANGLYRFKIEDSFYIRGNIQQVPAYYTNTAAYRNYSINNLKRSDTVVIRTSSGPNFNPAFPDGVTIGPNYITEATGVQFVDQSLTTLGRIDQANIINPANLNVFPVFRPSSAQFKDWPFLNPIASHYAGVKVRLRSQYGQLQSVKQIVITPCEQKFDYATLANGANINCDACNTDTKIKKVARTDIFFGGDVFINRYTEKNTMFFFYDWLFGQPDGFEYNYAIRQMIPEPRFYMNSKEYDVSDLSPTDFFSGSPAPGTGGVPTDFYNLDWSNYNYTTDNPGNYPGLLRAKDAYFYLATSGVRDFFVESDVLVDFRIAGDNQWEKHYDPYNYTNLPAMFDMNPDIITRGNWYRYDYSLSISKLYNQYFSSGNLQSRYYDPNVAKLCYTYLPDRIYYSLQQQDESFKDSWFIFLPNNYREFKSQISGVKSINKSGIFITFKNDSPLMFQGVDTLNTDLGTKITIGDGGLFSQPGQAVSNADKSYEYGSSQNRLAVISTPAGLFYVSQNQGKIFSYGSGLKEISQVGLKWWFTLFLRYKLTEYFPDYPWQDNPVAGIGIQAVYDNTNSILYFTKKDYVIRKDIDPATVEYIPIVTNCREPIGPYVLSKNQGDYFTLNGTGRYLLGDPAIFEDASWTVSYDPKNEFWISFHDWHPDLVIPTKNTFITTQKNTLWKHNFTCSSYCNFYGIDYPFEVEFPIISGQSPTVVKSIEYILECYRNAPNCADEFHVLDFNFDNAVLYNSEQVSGYLNLNLFPKNNITLSLQYPRFNPNIPIIINDLPTGLPGHEILFSKEENKYRFNQFWDTTKDRGEFPIGSDYPPTGSVIPGTTILQGSYDEQLIWNTQSNGYRRSLNLNNLDYEKALMQRKKFRHYVNYLNLRKEISGNTNMILKLVNSKNQYSPR
jgi:hypothetical protein